MGEAFQSALESLKREFQNAANLYPGLFYESFVPPDFIAVPDDVADLEDSWEGMWNSFVRANRAKDQNLWEEWHVGTSINACGRFYGNGDGVEVFKRLADSLNLVLYEMYETDDEEGGFFDCLELMFGTAGDYPTPLLRAKDRIWGVGEGVVLDKQKHDDLLAMMSEPTPGEESYPLHPYSMYFVHDVFVSAVAFIETILAPDRALRVGGGFSDRPPISLPGLIDPVVQAPPTVESIVAQIARLVNEHYIFKSFGETWLLRFPGDEDRFFSGSGMEYFARLLSYPDRPLEHWEVEGSVDPRLHVDFSTADILDQKTIGKLAEQIKDLERQLDYERKFGNDENKIKDLDARIKTNKNYLKQASAQSGRVRQIGNRGEITKSRNRVGMALKRAQEAIANEMPLLAAFLKRTVTLVPRQGKWVYNDKDHIPWRL